jgi:hypothetical protein
MNLTTDTAPDTSKLSGIAEYGAATAAVLRQESGVLQTWQMTAYRALIINLPAEMRETDVERAAGVFRTAIREAAEALSEAYAKVELLGHTASEVLQAATQATRDRPGPRLRDVQTGFTR